MEKGDCLKAIKIAKYRPGRYRSKLSLPYFKSERIDMFEEIISAYEEFQKDVKSLSEEARNEIKKIIDEQTNEFYNDIVFYYCSINKLSEDGKTGLLRRLKEDDEACLRELRGKLSN